MPVIRGYVNGTTAGQPGPGSSPDQRAKRGRITGWSPGAVRRHTRWLYAVDADGLVTADDAVGVSLTLTLARCPETPEDWERLRTAWIKRMRRLGVVRLHWVVEWQARGVPHMHCAAYFTAEHGAETWATLALFAWLDVAAAHGAKPRAQHWNTIDGPLGWLQYLSKHAARGVAHYQRQGKPAGWETTGRLWGYVGEWPVVEPWTIDAEWAAFWRLRRIVRLWRIADARRALLAAQTPADARQARRRITYARRMLSCPDRALSRVRGISEWIPLEQLEQLVDELARQGLQIATRDLLSMAPASAA
jgi:hypothetical protein